MSGLEAFVEIDEGEIDDALWSAFATKACLETIG
jgi:hypothetical protein